MIRGFIIWTLENITNDNTAKSYEKNTVESLITVKGIRFVNGFEFKESVNKFNYSYEYKPRRKLSRKISVRNWVRICDKWWFFKLSAEFNFTEKGCTKSWCKIPLYCVHVEWWRTKMWSSVWVIIPILRQYWNTTSFRAFLNLNIP